MGWPPVDPGRLYGRCHLTPRQVTEPLDGYGWHWRVAIEEGHQTFSARGYGGQFVYVVPDLDLVTVITSNPETSGVDPKILISRTIVPAVTS
jgi:CubicO group peptidase (beta-lactamase class C family)